MVKQYKKPRKTTQKKKAITLDKYQSDERRVFYSILDDDLDVAITALRALYAQQTYDENK